MKKKCAYGLRRIGYRQHLSIFRLHPSACAYNCEQILLALLQMAYSDDHLPIWDKCYSYRILECFTTNEMVEANVVILVMTIIFYVYGFADKYFSGKGCQSLISRL